MSFRRSFSRDLIPVMPSHMICMWLLWTKAFQLAFDWTSRQSTLSRFDPFLPFSSTSPWDRHSNRLDHCLFTNFLAHEHSMSVQQVLIRGDPWTSMNDLRLRSASPLSTPLTRIICDLSISSNAQLLGVADALMLNHLFFLNISVIPEVWSVWSARCLFRLNDTCQPFVFYM